ncbi:hypothetical protein D3C76_47960 [compost metagenome]
MTEEELAMLTDEERAGLEEDHDDIDEDDADEEGDGADVGDDDAGDGGDEEPGRDDGADQTDDAAGADEQEAAQDDERPVPQLKVNPVEDVEAKLADIDKREDDISQKFEDGDLTTSEYRAELRKLERERGGIERQQLEADLARNMNEAQATARWEENVKLFLADHPEISKSELRWGAFDTVVRKVTAETMKDGKNPGMADLKKAYRQWADDLGIEAPKPKAEQKAEAKTDTKSEKPKREIPPSLAKVPSAEISDTDDGKWAYLDRLIDTEPLKFEAALGKLSEADQDAYLNSR